VIIYIFIKLATIIYAYKLTKPSQLIVAHSSEKNQAIDMIIQKEISHKSGQDYPLFFCVVFTIISKIK